MTSPWRAILYNIFFKGRLLSHFSLQKGLEADPNDPDDWNCHVTQAPAGSASNGYVYYVRLPDPNASDKYLWVAQCKPVAPFVNESNLSSLSENAYKRNC